MSDEPVSQSAAIDAPVVPSTPDPATVAILAGQIRVLLSGLTGMGVLGGVWASVSDAQISALVSVGLTVVSAGGWIAVSVWSWWQRRKDQQKLHAAAVASASKRVPVQPA